jgi:hypothetical protein
VLSRSPLGGPSATRRLSDGVVVEASVVGRVFGIRLLRLNADIVIAPAQLPATSVEPWAPVAVRAPAPPPARQGRHGQALADAMRLIQESADGLDAARAEGRPRRR